MDTYTTIFFDKGLYQLNKHKLENLRAMFNVIWDEKKMQGNVPYGEILNIYKLFKSENRLLENEHLKDRHGAMGIWKNEVGALKVIVFDAYENESPPVLLVYRGKENEFYRTLVSMCIGMGCEIGKLVENESGIHEVYKRKLSPEVTEKLQSLERSKEIMNQLFDIRLDELQKAGHIFSDRFINLWKECIIKYGYYSNYNLGNEIQEKNKQNYDDNDDNE